MKRRTLLRISVKAALLAGTAAFAGVFVYGLFSPGLLSGDVIELGGIQPGSARLESWNGKPVWVVNRSESQLANLAGLSDYVMTPAPMASASVELPHRSLNRVYGVYLAETPRTGILVRYARDRPAGLPAGAPWHGGFVDPGSDALFDVAGRRYRNTRGAPLAIPPHRFTGAGAIRLGEW